MWEAMKIICAYANDLDNWGEIYCYWCKEDNGRTVISKRLFQLINYGEKHVNSHVNLLQTGHAVCIMISKE